MGRKRPPKTSKEKIVAWINSYTTSDWSERLVKVNHAYNFFDSSDFQQLVEFDGIKVLSDWLTAAYDDKQMAIVTALLKLCKTIPEASAANTPIATISKNIASNASIDPSVASEASSFLSQLESATDKRPRESDEEEQPLKKAKLVKGIQWADNNNKRLEYILFIKTRKQLEQEKRMAEQSAMGGRQQVTLGRNLIKRSKMIVKTLLQWHIPKIINEPDSITFNCFITQQETKRRQNIPEAVYYNAALVPDMPKTTDPEIQQTKPISIAFGSEEIAPLTADDEEQIEEPTHTPEPPSDIVSLLSDPSLLNALKKAEAVTETTQPQRFNQSAGPLYYPPEPKPYQYPPRPVHDQRRGYNQPPLANRRGGSKWGPPAGQNGRSHESNRMQRHPQRDRHGRSR